jgi:hypothetical protein
MSDYDKKCICGCPRSRHTYYDNNSGHCVDCGSMQCPEFRTAEEAKSEPAAESVYERARRALFAACHRGRLLLSIPLRLDDPDVLISAALDAGEAAEKRAEKAEKEIARLTDTLMGLEQNEAALWDEIHNALALLKPARPEDGLLPAIRDVLQRLVLAEGNHNE